MSIKTEEKNEDLSERELMMKKIKERGCVADGILTGYGRDEDENIDMINRSECLYLHRAVETWLEPPNFEDIQEIMLEFKNKEMLYGMFIAEAIDTKAEYYYKGQDRQFDFADMCRDGSKNFWGEHTCKPSFEKKEYQKYLVQITQDAIDSGVKVFMFGQIFYQDTKDLDKSLASEIIEEMRSYAAFRGVEIIVGAQTNDIDNEKYLKQFDFIEGGLGLKSNGNIENNACFSRWYKKEGDWCWALLWNDRFASKANNVLIHLDWSGKIGDDMSVFTHMSKDKRADVLDNLYNYFNARNIGFLMPYLTVLNKENGGCHGASRKYYSASREFSCDDEDAIDRIFKGNKFE